MKNVQCVFLVFVVILFFCLSITLHFFTPFLRQTEQINTKFVAISKIQSLQAAVAADNKMTKAAADEGPSSTVDQTFEGKAYVQV